MEYLDLCRMREVGYTSTKLHFASSRVRKPLKYTPLSVYVGDAFRISTWSLSRGLCFQVHNSWHSLFFCWRSQTALHCCGRPLLDWGWIACIRCKQSMWAERSGTGAERGAERSYFLWSGEHLLKISLRSLNALSTARSTQKPFGMGGAREGLAGAQHPQEKPKHPHSTPIKN